jgi:hypothetical protein
MFMKTSFTLLLLAFIGVGLSAQYALPVDFETPEEDTVWTQFANAGDDPANMALAENPATDGINPSANCLMFVVLDNADPWAGAWAEAYGEMSFTEEGHVMEMMVYKDKVSPSALKVEVGDGDDAELKVSNTKTGEWELLTFDLSAAVGHTYSRLTIFPDFPDERTSGGTVYIDNIQFAGGSTYVREAHGAEINVYPNPTEDLLTVKYPQMESVTLSNITGQVVRVVETGNVDYIRIDVVDLNSGVYFLTVDSPHGKVSSKFVKR